MRIQDYLNKPEYFHRPTQVFRRLWRGITPTPDTVRTRLPWDLPLSVRPSEVVGRAIWLTGAYELAVSEMIWRILRPGDIAADVGANVGYHTGLMALRVGGNGGFVRAFEPHPVVFSELAGNVAGWPEGVRAAVQLRQAAVSDRAGQAILHVPREFAGNRGVASIEAGAASTNEDVAVEATTLDREFDQKQTVRLLKIDVEGHELAALSGANELLRLGRIQSVIFEEHAPFPTPVSRTFTDAGYQLFKVLKTPLGPLLEEPGGPTPTLPFEAPNYLATLNPNEVIGLARARGWRCLA